MFGDTTLGLAAGFRCNRKLKTPPMSGGVTRMVAFNRPKARGLTGLGANFVGDRLRRCCDRRQRDRPQADQFGGAHAGVVPELERVDP